MSESTVKAPAAGAEVIEPGHTYATVTDQISAIVLAHQTPKSWWVGFSISLCFLMLFLYSTAYLLVTGIGIWGNNIPVAWAFDIINFVWWIGIGHAGTLISAVLLLFRQTWRTSINRFAEAMTLFAVACAGIYPLIHLGRPWLFYWLVPYPNTMGLWPQFRSPLVWDVFAVSTYATVSLLFWYVGLIPDLATLRDRAKWWPAQMTYGFLAMGWRGSATHWHRYQVAYLLLAGIATPLVVSVHSIVGLDFAASVVPGWHVTLFPPYFVAGAVFSGFAMVMTLSIMVLRMYGLHDFITPTHLSNMAKVMLATGLIVAYGYLMEVFFSWYSGNEYEWALQLNRAFGPYAWSYWMLIACNVLIPQLLWSRRVRHNVVLLFFISIIVNIGMWLERFVIIVVSLHRDFLPSAWGMYTPTFWDYAQFLGSIGLFMTLLFLFLRFLPVISIFELRELVHETSEPHAAGTPS
ncbi:MAG TPA: NrfD/PsrC family molybdoenzyme membrane anchor subunit [Planctomycetaceae bacterium]|jgi:molybdopterin-containing oxidoreductase family membrane subunit|nr:NrfD/PsrC family molybdoenzyme membrane anchor subunit [Planctomycetaceae bacterium]